jgi:hypothetical protein
VALRPGERHWTVFRQLANDITARANDIPDPYLAAYLCGVSRYVHCSLAVPRLVGRVSGTGCLLADLPANGGRRAEAGSLSAGLRRMTVLGGLRISA